MKYDPGIGATTELSLRVSVATLVRVLFQHPRDGEWMLALERQATLHGHQVDVKSQPFGGAIRILDVDTLHDLVGDFHFDSERSRAEQDFRLFIQPVAWSVLRESCLRQINVDDDLILKTNLERELTEEFFDTLKIGLKREQYVIKSLATLVENEAAATENVHARGYPTVRVYRLFEASITDPALAHAMLTNSESLSHEGICELALADARNGGKGWANAMWVLPLKHLADHYAGMPPKERNAPILFEEQRLDETVPAILEGITVPKYQRL